MLAFYVALGGAFGTLLRYGLARAAEGASYASWPFATFAVNVVGSFALGAVAVALEGRNVGGHDLRAILGTGVLGGFTTYSTFNLETLRMVERGELGRAGGYVLLTVLACLGAGAAGLVCGRALSD